MQFIGWRMQFYCQLPLVEEVQEQAKQMEDELERWSKEVVDARRRFYELNYYTMRQLLVLRRELGRMKSEQASQLHPHGQVMALLESISSAIPPHVLADVVHNVGSEVEERYKEVGHLPALNSTPVEREGPLETLSLPAVPLVNQLAPGTQLVLRNLSSSPPVRLSQDDLNGEQMSQFTNICESGYCEVTALKAIEEVRGGDLNDIFNWLKNHGEEFESAEDEAGAGGNDAESENEEQEDSDFEVEDQGKNSVDLSPTESDHTEST